MKNLNDNKWVVDYGNTSSNIILSQEFDSEEEAIEWGKEMNKAHIFNYGDCAVPLTYLHLVYEPKFEDVAPPSHENEVAVEESGKESDK